MPTLLLFKIFSGISLVTLFAGFFLSFLRNYFTLYLYGMTDTVIKFLKKTGYVFFVIAFALASELWFGSGVYAASCWIITLVFFLLFWKYQKKQSWEKDKKVESFYLINSLLSAMVAIAATFFVV